MKNTEARRQRWESWVLFLGLLILICLASRDIFTVAGHGAFLGHFDKIWGAVFVAFLVVSIGILAGAAFTLWFPEKTSRALKPILAIRARLRWLMWLLALLAVAWPAVILLYTGYGFDLTPFAIRLYLFALATVLGGTLLTNDHGKPLTWVGLLQSIVLFGAVFLMALMFVPVTNYPLSLTWSEGNRMWDYSVLFGRDLYIYPTDKPLEAYIDIGRQSLWGLPFLLPEVTIWQVRMWSALVFTVPYAVLGWILFRIPKNKSRGWLVAGLWVMLFLNQGPIYTPLVLAAILVALPRRWPIWLGLPMIFLAGYYAQMSRFTWMLAPAIWAAMMAINDHPLVLSRQKLKNWVIVSAYGLAGFIGGFGLSGWQRLQSYFDKVSANVSAPSLPNPTVAVTPVAEASSKVATTPVITDQPLLWSRLWPNPTYPEGIILGLLLATGALIVFLLYLVAIKRWPLNRWQKAGLLLPMLAFLVVGIVISVKIGGGSNLHNLDMFLIGLVFVAAFAWDGGGWSTIHGLDTEATWLRIVVLLIAAIPAFYPVIGAKPLQLSDLDKTAYTVDLIQKESRRAVSNGGEVLFMDQRQLLTFGFVKGIPLVAEYEKKLVMDKAMSSDRAYFEDFYRDISNQRYALIITEPQNVRYAKSDDDFGEENDVWVEWVTKPLLCYYEPAHAVKKTAVWLLVPRAEPLDCTFP